MNFRNIFATGVITMLGLCAVSCGSGNDGEKIDVEDQNSQLTEALQSHDMQRVSLLADSMAMYIDDLTPEETVTVLMAFLEIHNDASKAGNRIKDLETIRKFVDVYDIALSINPNDFKGAIAQVRKINPNVDIPSIVADFRDKLAEYEALSGEPEPEQTSAPKDSTGITDSPKAEEVATADETPEIVKPEE